MIISVENFQRCVNNHCKWDLKGHVDNIYMRFNNYDYEQECLKKQLKKWQANRGAEVDWDTFFRQKDELLQEIPTDVDLSNLEKGQVRSIVKIVTELDRFKDCKPTMVFGSKVAHFHHPHLIPVLDSEVRQALNRLERHHAEEIQEIAELEKNGGRLYFPKQGRGKVVFKNYLLLGNHYLRDNDEQTGRIISYINNSYGISLGLQAKIFEWCLLGWKERREPE